MAESEKQLFHELTGLQLHVVWHNPLDWSRPGISPIRCPSAGQRLNAANSLSVNCVRCNKERWSLPEMPAARVCRVEGLCGRTSLCAAVKAGQIHPVTLVAQSGSTSGPQDGRRSPSAARTTVPSEPANAKPVPEIVALRLAESLMGWLHRRLEAILQTRMAEAELKDTGMRLQHLAVANARLRKELHRRIPEIPELEASHPAGGHAEQIVQEMLDYVRQHYRHPMSLGEVADTLRMNPAYLSSLFSKTAGVTFHRYLDEVRLAKAEELLQQTCIPVCEVACAVGYATSNHFREVFKAREGLSPTAWRQIRQPGTEPLIQAVLPFSPS